MEIITAVNQRAIVKTNKRNECELRIRPQRSVCTSLCLAKDDCRVLQQKLEAIGSATLTVPAAASTESIREN